MRYSHLAPGNGAAAIRVLDEPLAALGSNKAADKDDAA